MKYTFYPKGVCSREYIIELSQGTIKDIEIIGGCDGNLHGIMNLLKGMKVSEAIERLRGIRCGFKSTSCPDQISYALENALQQEKDAL